MKGAKHSGTLLMVVGAVLVLFYPTLWVYGKVSQLRLHQQWSQRVAAGHPEVSNHVFGRLVLPRLGLDDIVLEGVGEKELAAGPGHHPDTAGNGEGNCVIFGHLNVDGSPFRDLDQLQVGDLVDLETDTRLVIYKVASHRIVGASDVDLLDPAPEPQLLLVTCMPGARQRYVVVCKKTDL